MHCTITAWKKLQFILLNRLNFYMIDNLSIVINAFARGILISFSVDEMLLPRYVNFSTNFREPSFLIKTHIFHFVCIHMEANTTYCLLQTMQLEFSLGRCICRKRYVVCVVCIHNFCFLPFLV